MEQFDSSVEESSKVSEQQQRNDEQQCASCVAELTEASCDVNVLQCLFSCNSNCVTVVTATASHRATSNVNSQGQSSNVTKTFTITLIPTKLHQVMIIEHI